MKAIKTIYSFFQLRKVQLAVLAAQYLFSSIGNLQSQCVIPNGDFESWYSYDTVGLSGSMETIHAPSDWCDFFCLVGYPNLAYGLEETTPGAEGSAAAVKITPGFDFFGIKGMAYSTFACNEVPSVFKGFYKFTGALPDTLLVYAAFLRNDPGADTLVPVGGVEVTLYETAEEFTSFEVPVEFIPGETPEVVQIFIIGQAKTEGSPDNYFVLDELRFESGISAVDPDTQLQAHFQIFPVPVAEELYLDFSENFQETANVTAQIFNATGQLVMQERFSDLPTQLQVAQLTGGIYFLKIFTEKQAWTAKWVKQ